jgi:hypothetical protein
MKVYGILSGFHTNKRWNEAIYVLGTTYDTERLYGRCLDSLSESGKRVEVVAGVTHVTTVTVENGSIMKSGSSRSYATVEMVNTRMCGLVPPGARDS